jgi:hypothetical protein
MLVQNETAVKPTRGRRAACEPESFQSAAWQKGGNCRSALPERVAGAQLGNKRRRIRAHGSKLLEWY